MLYILTYFNMDMLYRIFNILFKISFWLIIYDSFIIFKYCKGFVNNCVIQPLAAMQFLIIIKLSIYLSISTNYAFLFILSKASTETYPPVPGFVVNNVADLNREVRT